MLFLFICKNILNLKPLYLQGFFVLFKNKLKIIKQKFANVKSSCIFDSRN